jgi:pyruvate/2-oxoacid:ferredoxin oxidoreductase alpha subunit
MAACIGAANTGVRTFTATSSQGLALMHELLFWAGGARLPIVMSNVHRVLAPPTNIGADQTDSFAQRDTGWIQLECESAQEILDSILQAYRIAEAVMLPCMVCHDAFYLSHTYEPVDIPEAELVDSYLPPYIPPFKLDSENRLTFYASSTPCPATHYEYRYHAQQAMERVPAALRKADEHFYELFGRRYGIVEEYYLDGAELVIVAAGSMVSTIRRVVEELRQQGERVGLLRIRMFRPFPKEEIRHFLKGVPKVAVFDRNISLGEGGILCQSVKSALYHTDQKPVVFGFIVGLCAVDITPDIIKNIVDYALQQDTPEKDIIWTEAIV